MDRLKLDPMDVFEDVNDISLLDEIKRRIEQERDDLELYRKKKKQFDQIMSNGGKRLSDDTLMSMYSPGTMGFTAPTHRYNGKQPMMCILFDDCVGSLLFTKGIRKLNQLVNYHRHLGQFQEGGALGCSLFFLVQSYKCQAGGISKCIRGNVTSLAVGKTKSGKELLDIAEECSNEVSQEQFLALHKHATGESKYDFLFIDFHPKDEHPSGFRQNLSPFLIP